MKISRLIPKPLLFRVLFLVNFLDVLKGNNYKLNTFFPLLTNHNLRKKGFVLSNYGVWMLDNQSDKTFRLSILGYRNKLERYLKSINRPFVFWDIGSNQGVFSLVANKNPYCKNIICFEPNTDLIFYLTSNLVFGRVKNYQIHNYAISNKVGKIEFFIPNNHTGAATMCSNAKSNIVFESVNRSYLDKINTKEDDIFLKLDVEGAEHLVLIEIFESIISKNIKYIFIEINQNYNNSKIIRSILSKNNFVEVDRKGSLDSCDAFFEKRPNQNIRFTANLT